MERNAAKKQNVFSWLVTSWKKNPLFSTACVLVVMVVLQTLALGFDYDTVGEWFQRYAVGRSRDSITKLMSIRPEFARVQRGGEEFVLKQIHHEPCSYYTFGNKIEAEQRDYHRLLEAGIPIPKMLDIDIENERILKEYIPVDFLRIAF